jgi:hypothetical protein
VTGNAGFSVRPGRDYRIHRTLRNAANVRDVLTIVAEVWIDNVGLFDRRGADSVPGTYRTTCIAENAFIGDDIVAHHDLPFIMSFNSIM